MWELNYFYSEQTAYQLNDLITAENISSESDCIRNNNC